MYAMPGRGEVFWVDLNPVVGSEQGNRRPCLIVSPDALNKIERNQTVVVIPITSKGKADRLRLVVSAGDVTGYALIQQQRTLDKSRLITLIGTVSPEELEEVLARLRQFYS